MAETLSGSCHCGAVRFEVDLEDGVNDVVRCNCSLCRRKGTVMMAVPRERLRIVAGAENLAVYEWNTRVAKHYFCKTCGIYTHHQRRSDPSQYGFNVACIDDVDPYAFEEVRIVDGAALSGGRGD